MLWLPSGVSGMLLEHWCSFALGARGDVDAEIFFLSTFLAASVPYRLISSPSSWSSRTQGCESHGDFSSVRSVTSVLAVSGYSDVVSLPLRSNCRLAAIGIGLSEQNAARIATYVRRTWPGAKILLLGRPSGLFDDPLYDDSVLSSGNPAEILKAASQLLNGMNGTLTLFSLQT